MKEFILEDYNDKVDFRDFKELTDEDAIKAKCIECCCWDREEVKLCTIHSCPLWPFKNVFFNNED